ncbi:cytochrome-c oxidase, cbb3-type subunit III [Enterovirga rhinocerotis]|uniref:Cbb3-type cytochrome c oxidase subunit n=1 Tax=Enterovirga rhinocerotis TaxID=1339210 RepID=A0A4R7C7F2_9HYPH|nr:cytochrome-c oxidase, cbb3-type subunit III [Enterovirga rhinocerotis]TDR94073.1 cytochrome c oxidase cbb3-type subunit 3 [Enterovirga rhinocerotis]
MAIEERDSHTGYLTTGHEWNGIKELNTPVPKAVYVFLIATVVFTVAYIVLMPAIPLGVTFTKGLLGLDDRREVTRAVEDAAAERAVWTKRIETGSYQDVAADPALMRSVRQTGRTLFTDNCAVCHGTDAKGGHGYPSLVSGSPLWGSDADSIAETIRVGINATHPKTRVGQMLAFGRDGILQRADVDNVLDYVLTLSGQPPVRKATPEQLAAGKATFAAQCVSCHGEDGKGKADLGAPDLTDRHWIYGGDAQSILTTIWNGRQGHMPSWEDRLSPVDRKILTLYLMDLRKSP